MSQVLRVTAREMFEILARVEELHAATDFTGELITDYARLSDDIGEVLAKARLEGIDRE